MSYPLQSFLVTLFGNDTTIVPLLGVQQNGQPAVYPFHHADVNDPVYPLITVARMGSRSDTGMFAGSDFATLMDAPKIAICAWSKKNIDVPWAIYRRIRDLLISPSSALGNQYFTVSRMNEALVRDDLYEDDDNLYHLHTEYDCWVKENATTQIAIPT